MLFITNKGLYVNMDNIKFIDPIQEGNTYLVTMVDGDELIFSGESGRELIRRIGAIND